MIGKTYTMVEISTAAPQPTRVLEIASCKDCKWIKVPRYFITKYWKHARCTRPSLPRKFDYVTGKYYTPEVFCDVERNPDYDELEHHPDYKDRCGSRGRHFVLK